MNREEKTRQTTNMLGARHFQLPTSSAITRSRRTAVVLRGPVLSGLPCLPLPAVFAAFDGSGEEIASTQPYRDISVLAYLPSRP